MGTNEMRLGRVQGHLPETKLLRCCATLWQMSDTCHLNTTANPQFLTAQKNCFCKILDSNKYAYWEVVLLIWNRHYVDRRSTC